MKRTTIVMMLGVGLLPLVLSFGCSSQDGAHEGEDSSTPSGSADEDGGSDPGVDPGTGGNEQDALIFGHDDADGDGETNVADNCIFESNAGQEDKDRDSIGDACDNCPEYPNVLQEDADSDGIGDACAPGAPGSDDDNDSIAAIADNCPNQSNAGQEDADADGRGDVCDNCIHTANSGQEDLDQNGEGDACQGIDFPSYDADADGHLDSADNCVVVSNPAQADGDGDGIGDLCDNCADRGNPRQEDLDNDGVGDACQQTLPPQTEVCHDLNLGATGVKPNIYILLDRSGSMDDDRKWEQAVEALDTLADTLTADSNVGLGLFPNAGWFPNNEWNLPDRRLDMAPDNSAAAFRSAYRNVQPDGATPMAKAMYRVEALELYDFPNDPLADMRPRSVVLITDGKPEEDRCCPENAAAKLLAAGVRVYVVGFGKGVDPDQLQAVAVAGGTDNPAENNQNWYYASDTDGLVDALSTIATLSIGCSVAFAPEPEIDTSRIQVDMVVGGATQTVPFDSVNGYSVAEAGNNQVVTLNGQSCATLRDAAAQSVDGSDVQLRVRVACAACLPFDYPDTCDDLVDNNCNGLIDEGCVCAPERCGDGVDNDCDNETDEGCPTCLPVVEICGDGTDNDCDGEIDEDCAPVCRPFLEVCDGLDNDCDGLEDNGEEICGDEIDNDCDGEIDENCLV